MNNAIEEERKRELYSLCQTDENPNPNTNSSRNNNDDDNNGKTEYTLGGKHVFNALSLARRLDKTTDSPEVELTQKLSIRDVEAATIPMPSTTKKQQAQDSVPLTRYVTSLVFCNKISVLLLFLPLGFLAHYHNWSAQYIFWFNFLGMIPLASVLGEFTEELALHTNQVIGGLINATFGNAVEMVVAIQALQANEIRVVQASLLGSIFSNLLLVLGCCFFFGGLKYKEQRFNRTAATANISLLALSSIGFVLPTPFAEYYEIQNEQVLWVSRVSAIFLLFMYLQLLLFQLKTHVDLFNNDDDDVPNIPFTVALGGIVVVTFLVTIFSDFLVDSIDDYVTESGVSRTFVGTVLLPVIGNAVEHMTAVTVAMKNKMDLSIGIAIGSSVQISLFVVPFSVLVGWVLDKNMTLNFPQFEIILYILSIIVVSICISNTKSNWLLGSLLITTYVLLGLGFWSEKLIAYR